MIYLTIDNFKKIKNYIIVEGDLRPWSNLYGDGTLFEFNNIRVIYFPAQIMDNPIAHSWNEFLLIDHKKYKLSFHIENDNNKILVTNDSEYYYGNKMDLDKSNKEANIIFSNILKLVK